MPERVLIAHHRPALRHWLRYQVGRMFGMSVVAETSEGLSAFAQAIEEKPDLALISTGLPLLDGFELARHLHAALPGCRIFLLTEKPDEEDPRRLREVGAVGHLPNRDIERLGHVLATLNTHLQDGLPA